MSTRETLVTAATMMLLVSVTGWAQRGRGPGGFHGGPTFRSPERHVVAHPPVGARHIIVGGHPYWVCGGVYYDLVGDEYIVVGAPVVRVLPRSYHVVVVHGIVYYVADDVYYRPGPGGYVVVERPVEPAQPVVATPPAETSTVTIYAPNKDADGFTPVVLKKVDGGFLGPQGEFYPTMPRVSLLTEMYGIPEILRDTASDRTYFIHVPNRDGQTYTRVELTRRNNGFVGPQGEFYPIMPSVAHLAEMYGTGQAKEPAAPAAPAIPDVPAIPAAPAVPGVPAVPAAEAPIVSSEPAKTDDGTIHVQIHKKNGQGTVDVILKRRDKGFVGPQGEFYPEMPTPSQLAEVYGGE